MATEFTQVDRRWSDMLLSDSNVTIGQGGDLLTSLASVICDLTGVHTDPGRLNRWLCICEGYTIGPCINLDNLCGIGLKVVGASGSIGLQQAEGISEDLTLYKKGIVALVVGTNGESRHWVRILDVTQHSFTIMDPWVTPGIYTCDLEVHWCFAFAFNNTPVQYLQYGNTPKITQVADTLCVRPSGILSRGPGVFERL